MSGSWLTFLPPGEDTRRFMQSIRRRDTAPEVALRSALHRRGLRFRVDKVLIAGSRRRADIVFGPARVVVFVDGCFWHRCPVHHVQPKRNADYWRDKMARNKARDVDTDAKLEALGWLVLHVWEHDDPVSTAEWIRAVVAWRMEDG